MEDHIIICKNKEKFERFSTALKLAGITYQYSDKLLGYVCIYVSKKDHSAAIKLFGKMRDKK